MGTTSPIAMYNEMNLFSVNKVEAVCRNHKKIPTHNPVQREIY